MDLFSGWKIFLRKKIIDYKAAIFAKSYELFRWFQLFKILFRYKHHV